MSEADELAESTGDFDDLANGSHQIVRSTDHRRRCRRRGDCAATDLLEGLVGVVIRNSTRSLQRADDVFVVPALHTVACLTPSVFACLGQMPAHHDSPVGAVDNLTVFRCCCLGETPLGR